VGACCTVAFQVTATLVRAGSKAFRRCFITFCSIRSPYCTYSAWPLPFRAIPETSSRDACAPMPTVKTPKSKKKLRIKNYVL
jgi:hypothetical protein